jgi:biotin--protein ligase
LIVNGKRPRSLDNLYYNGGGHFILPSPVPSNVEVLATYGETGKVAAVTTEHGKGKTILCSVHFEYPLNDPPAKDAIQKQEHAPSSEGIEQSERERIDFAEEILLLLGLMPPRRADDNDHSVQGDEDPELLLHPTHPSPIFVFNHPTLPQLASASFEPPALKSKLSDEGSKKVLRDGNDELHIMLTDTIAVDGGAAGVAAHLASMRRSKPIFPPPVQELSIEPSATTPEPPLPPDFNSLPKTILLSSNDIAYTPRWTPLFNFETYWSELDESRKRVGKKSGVMRPGEKIALGDLVWYAETITSTQTILDR